MALFHDMMIGSKIFVKNPIIGTLEDIEVNMGFSIGDVIKTGRFHPQVIRLLKFIK